MYFLVYPLLWIFSLLPFKILYFLSDILYLITYYIVGYRRKVVRKNLVQSFPEKTAKEIKLIEQKFYHFFCDLLLETVKEFTLNEKVVRKRVEFRNTERMVELLKENKSILIMMAHYGNWEWLTFFPVALQNADFKSFQIYKQLRNHQTDKLVYNLRKRFGGINVEKHQLLRTIFKNVQANTPGVYWMLSDQMPSIKNTGMRLTFLHQNTAVLTGTEQLSHKFDFPVFYAKITRPYRGKYIFDFIPVTEEPLQTAQNDITIKYFELLEESVLERPELWLWSHKRWKR